MDIIIHPASDVPIYEQIVSEIRRMILAGRLKKGDALPSMRLLAKDLRVSVITTKRAYEELEHLGLIETSVGRGSFVRVDSGHADEMIEEYERIVREKLTEAVKAAKQGNLPLDQVRDELIKIYLEGERP